MKGWPAGISEGSRWVEGREGGLKACRLPEGTKFLV